MNKIYTKEKLDAELSKSKKVLVIFYAKWCPYCMRFIPFFNKKIAPLGYEHIVHAMLDDYDNPMWDEYGISAVPTIILFEDSKIVNRLDARLGSGLSEEQFEKWIEEVT